MDNQCKCFECGKVLSTSNTIRSRSYRGEVRGDTTAYICSDCFNKVLKSEMHPALSLLEKTGGIPTLVEN